MDVAWLVSMPLDSVPITVRNSVRLNAKGRAIGNPALSDYAMDSWQLILSAQSRDE